MYQFNAGFSHLLQQGLEPWFIPEPIQKPVMFGQVRVVQHTQFDLTLEPVQRPGKVGGLILAEALATAEQYLSDDSPQLDRYRSPLK